MNHRGRPVGAPFRFFRFRGIFSTPMSFINRFPKSELISWIAPAPTRHLDLRASALASGRLECAVSHHRPSALRAWALEVSFCRAYLRCRKPRA